MVSQIKPQNYNFCEQNGNPVTKYSPVNQEAVGEYIEPSNDCIREGVKFLKSNLDAVKRLGIHERARILFKLADIVEANVEMYAQLTFVELGKPKQMGIGEAFTAASFMRSIAGVAQFVGGDVIPSKNNSKLVINERRPYGLAGLIVSFNTPLPNYAWKIAPTWLSGNSFILKPSEHNPFSSTLFIKHCIEAGMPQECVGLLLGGANAGTALVEQDLDLLSFTGSHSVGVSIQQKSAKVVRKTILELGGTNPIIVFPDANLEAAADEVIQSAFSNSGQRCAAGSILFVHTSIKNKFLDLVQLKLRNFKVGLSDACSIGPVVDKGAADKFDKIVRLAEAAGAKISFHGDIQEEGMLLRRPAIIELDSFQDLAREECFVPILRVLEFKSELEVLEFANGLDYGLTSAVWTNSLAIIESFRQDLNFGVININGPTHGAEFQFPFGGRRMSGNGTKEVGMTCLNEYSFQRIFTIDFSK